MGRLESGVFVSAHSYFLDTGYQTTYNLSQYKIPDEFVSLIPASHPIAGIHLFRLRWQ